MQKDPYIILGISPDSTQDEIKSAYDSLKKLYEEQCFQEGEIGSNATKKLAELERAYQDCMDNVHQNIIYENTGSSFGEIETLIKDGKLEDAQSQLDRIENRDAEWHYLQAVIYYKRNWHMESKKQLEIALALDEGNSKYKGALDRLNKVIEGANTKQNTAQADNAQQAKGGYARPTSNDGANNVGTCCDVCNCLICTDCCCECTGGDFIPCC